MTDQEMRAADFIEKQMDKAYLDGLKAERAALLEMLQIWEADVEGYQNEEFKAGRKSVFQDLRLFIEARK